MGKKLDDLTGKIFSLLKVIKYEGKDSKGRNQWLCECTCENKTPKIVHASNLRSGNVKSCGCLNNIEDLTGRIYGNLQILSYAGRNKHNKPLWNCLCSCDKNTKMIVDSESLKSGKTKGCGCMRGFIRDITSNKYGKLTAIKIVSKNKYGYHSWLCECECGGSKVVGYDCLENGHTQSCGCIKKSNTFEFNDDCITGITKKGERFYFDTEDYDIVLKYTWYIKNDYVVANDKNNKMIFMHRLVMNIIDDNIICDHRDHNTKDNRKMNLRQSTISENQMNKTIQRNNTSGVTGVSWFKTRNTWVVRINVNKKRIIIGYFKNFEEAVKARKEAERKYFGEFRYQIEDDVRFKEGNINEIRD
ncbi:hypothetical protein [Paenibacillus elgii]|uniref:hypothetical protein n=1 Tax=Paenibacillus elgii TaxID=189691 RepID=UPI0002F08CF9|nr:hypothetical protein [Paenibacillus elgii]